MSSLGAISGIAALVAPTQPAAIAAGTLPTHQIISAGTIATHSLPVPQQSRTGNPNRCKFNRTIGQKRHRKILKDSVLGVTRPNIKRIARRAGCPDISNDVYDTTRAVIKERLEEIVKKLVFLCFCADKKNVVTASDVAYVLKQMAQPIAGFGGARVRTCDQTFR